MSVRFCSMRTLTPGTSWNHCAIVLQSSSMPEFTGCPFVSAWHAEPQVPKRLAQTGLPSEPSADATMPVVAAMA